ncbi:MAG: hypothetical protein MZV63_41215 [Marinilabiliales bacterium]|nr:hypothetical protein [Marinilabiliales bacterium]
MTSDLGIRVVVVFYQGASVYSPVSAPCAWQTAGSSSSTDLMIISLRNAFWQGSKLSNTDGVLSRGPVSKRDTNTERG